MESFNSKIVKMYGEASESWLNQLPEQIKHLAVLWKLSDLIPVDNLSYNYRGLLEFLPNDPAARASTIARKDISEVG